MFGPLTVIVLKQMKILVNNKKVSKESHLMHHEDED